MSDVKRQWLDSTTASTLKEIQGDTEDMYEGYEEYVLAFDYDALAAENARLRQAVAEIERMLLEDCTTWSQIQDALHMALASSVQPSDHWPECSVCRRRHGPETQHPCE